MTETIRVTHVLSDGRAFSHLHYEDGSAFYDSRKPGSPGATFRWERAPKTAGQVK